VKPYYSHAGVTIYHGDCREILPKLNADVCITDPPYDEHTHKNARGTTRHRFKPGEEGSRKLVTFDPMEDREVLSIFGSIGRATRRWVVATCAWQHCALLGHQTPDPLRFIRFGAWMKRGGMPQLTGDRPGVGWEAVAILHRTGEPMRWNGGGKCAAWLHTPLKVEAEWPTQKPIEFLLDLVSLFSDPGETVLDPFMGSGTTLLAAKDLGRKAIGVEREERACEIAARRLAQDVLFGPGSIGPWGPE
jgi:site-specific DNA-methyltransferase (adenine-specific)